MKKVLLALLLLFIFSTSSLCFAFDWQTTPPEQKPKLALLYVNNSKTTYDDEIDKKMNDNFTSLLSNYDIIAGTKYVERLNKNGITDITTAERGDIIDAFKGEDVDYVLFCEVQPFVRKERITFFTYGIDMTAIVPIKIIDLKTEKYIYNGKFTEFVSDSSMIGGIGNKSVSMSALDKVIFKMNTIIEARLPLSKHVTPKQE
ncbi:MAG: hypothetical protein ABFD79_07365 [Phycisphaerales bacterium]